MIPSFMDDDTPPGEREVFNLIAAGPDDWVVLHSLDLAPWNRGLRTEIDFLVIVPDMGILCIEVKSHESITFDGSIWHPNTITKSPFKQATNGRYTFYRRLTELLPQFKRFPVVACCIFPRSVFNLSPNLSVQPWELMDSRAFRNFNSGKAFCADLRARINLSVEADEKLNHPIHPLSQNQIETIVESCVPIQKFCPNARDEIARREVEIDKILREQQKPVLRLAELNYRVVVSGGAGTGKTLIAMEVARRWAERGQRVALLCYNQLVGNWMRQKCEQVIPRLPNLVTGRAISVMAEMSGILIPPCPPENYWEIILPQEIESRVTDPDFRAEATFDCLVLDEAQDLLARPRLWQCLNQLLSCGIEEGTFALFGDFDHQVLASRESVNNALVQLDLSGRPVHWKLSENCRNYRIIGETAVRLAGLKRPVYSEYLRTGGGANDYDIYFYKDKEDQLRRIGQYIREFKVKGYRPSEISLLSFRADHLSAAMSLKRAGYKIRPAWQQNQAISFASVHAFKGMENKVIILTDMVLDDLEFQRDLFYTGMTRATESVRVLCDQKSKDTILKWLARGDAL